MSAKSPISLHRLIEQRLSRRRLLAAGSGVALAGMLPGCTREIGQPSQGTGFSAIVPAGADTVVVPAGYRSYTVARWGDPLFPDTPGLDATAVARGGLLRPGAAQAQARQFGYNCDGMGLFPLTRDRLVACINNEFPSPALMFPGWRSAAGDGRIGEFVASNPESVGVMQAAVGLSIVELVRDGERWRLVTDSQYNRRVTANTLMEMSGPASEHEALGGARGAVTIASGTFGNCAAGTTPWGTYLTCEENVHEYFGNGQAAELTPRAREFHERFGYRRRGSAYGWEFTDARFDMQIRPNELLKFGWVVEVDPLNPADIPRKLTALGRFRHEGATTVVAPDGRVVVYMGDDQAFEYFYKFVSRRRFDAQNPAASRDILDDGVLYAARLEADGTGTWLPLVWSADGPLSPATGFDSPGDVAINCRGAADLLQATPLDRPEDVAVDSRGRVYLACTQNTARGAAPAGMAAARGIDTGTDAASPRVDNRAGHILEFSEAGGDPTAEKFQWEILVLAGAAEAGRLIPLLDTPLRGDAVYYGGVTDPEGISSFANPDNLAVDSADNLWIVTDGNQPAGNNGCFVCALDGPQRGVVRQFMEGPVGAEICGCEFTRDEQTLFLTVQHPGAGGTVNAPISSWPDGEGSAPRPSLVAIESLATNTRIGE